MLEREFTDTNLGYDANLFYSIRGGSTFVTNTVVTLATNIVTSFVTNNTTTFTTNIVSTFTATNTVTAVGADICQGRSVRAAATCVGPIVSPAPAPDISEPLSQQPIMASIRLQQDGIILSWPATAGATYAVQFRTNLLEGEWLAMPGIITAVGNVATKTDALPPEASRFYRVLSVSRE